MNDTEILREKAAFFSGLAYDYTQACRELIEIIEQGKFPPSVIDKYEKVGEALARLADKHAAFDEWLVDNTNGVVPLRW
jgi:hypothetical protein